MYTAAQRAVDHREEPTGSAELRDRERVRI